MTILRSINFKVAAFRFVNVFEEIKEIKNIKLRMAQNMLLSLAEEFLREGYRSSFFGIRGISMC